MSEYKTPKGRVLTDADIEALADEAEQGYDVDHLKKPQWWQFYRLWKYHKSKKYAQQVVKKARV